MEQERLDDFLSILPSNLDNETNKTIEEYLWILMENITLFERFEWIGEETLNEIVRNLVNTFKIVVALLIKNEK